MDIEEILEKILELEKQSQQKADETLSVYTNGLNTGKAMAYRDAYNLIMQNQP